MKPLYIFLHINKCAGSTIESHIRNTFKKDELLFSYSGGSTYNIAHNNEKYIKSLTKEQKDNIKVILGHRVHYGIHELFPDREARYVTFLRNPVDRTISHYNFRRMILEDEMKPKKLEEFRKKYIKNGRIISFEEWLSLDTGFSENYIFKYLSLRLIDENKNIKLENDKLREIKEILNKFYFVGVTEQPEDFLFFYNELGISKFLHNKNVSKKYFSPKGKDYEEAKNLILPKNKYDKEIYDYALELNKKFKSEHTDFYQKTGETKKKISNYEKKHRLAYPIKIILKNSILPLFRKFHTVLQKHPIREIGNYIIFAHARTGSTTLYKILKCIPEAKILYEPFKKSKSEYPDKENPTPLNNIDDLDIALSKMFHDFNGFKHISGNVKPIFNDHILSKKGIKFIFLYRKNILRSVISANICKIIEDWGWRPEVWKEKASSTNFEAMDADEIKREVYNLKNRVARQKLLLEEKNQPFFEISYEKLFGENIAPEKKLAKILEILVFLGIKRNLTGDEIAKIKELLDANNMKLSSENLYLKIPNIKKIEETLGSDATGWLFK